jgi:hypothetical protein
MLFHVDLHFQADNARRPATLPSLDWSQNLDLDATFSGNPLRSVQKGKSEGHPNQAPLGLLGCGNMIGYPAVQ